MPNASKNTSREHMQSAKKEYAEQTDVDGPFAARTSIASASVASTSAPDPSATGASASNDPSQWRLSKLRDSDTITKTNASNQYRLRKEDDLQGTPYKNEEAVVGGVIRPMYIYKERDVERRAWEKHGGPEKFDTYLARLKEQYIKKNGPNAHFPQPRTYTEDQRPQISNSHLSQAPAPSNST